MPSCKYVNFTAHKTPVNGDVCNVTQFSNQDAVSQFVSSYPYLADRASALSVF